MNKVVPTILAMSALLITAGCSSSGAKHPSYSNHGVSASHASYSGGAHAQAGATCSTCGTGYRAVPHGHSRHANGSVVTHTHAGTSGHGHSGLSASHSYVNTASHAGRNTYVNTGGAAHASGGSGSAFAKVAGALLIGGLVYSVAKDDDDDKPSSGGHHKK